MLRPLPKRLWISKILKCRRRLVFCLAMIQWDLMTPFTGCAKATLMFGVRNSRKIVSACSCMPRPKEVACRAVSLQLIEDQLSLLLLSVTILRAEGRPLTPAPETCHWPNLRHLRADPFSLFSPSTKIRATKLEAALN